MKNNSKKTVKEISFLNLLENEISENEISEKEISKKKEKKKLSEKTISKKEKKKAISEMKKLSEKEKKEISERLFNISLYGKKENSFILKNGRMKINENLKEFSESEKAFISIYNKIESLKINSENIESVFLIERLKSQAIEKLFGKLKKKNKIQFRIDYLFSNIKKSIKNGKKILSEKDFSENSENIFGKSENFEIHFYEKINLKYIFSEIERLENEKLEIFFNLNGISENEKKNFSKFESLKRISERKENLKSEYIKESIDLKEISESLKKEIIFKSERLFRKFEKKNISIQKKKILSIFQKEIESLKENEMKKEKLFQTFHNEKVKENKKLKKLSEYFIENYFQLLSEYMK